LNEVIPMPRSKSTRANRASLKSTIAVPPAAVEPAGNDLLLEPEVMVRCRMSRSQIWKLEQAGEFPKRKRYGFRRVAWPEREIEAWRAMGIDAWVASQAAAA
jgi:predicted DNA-binding transcriptional regulator AlpA